MGLQLGEQLLGYIVRVKRSLFRGRNSTDGADFLGALSSAPAISNSNDRSHAVEAG